MAGMRAKDVPITPRPLPDLDACDPQVRSVLEVATRFINHHASSNYPDEAPITLQDWFSIDMPDGSTLHDPPALILDSRPSDDPTIRLVTILGDPYHSEGGPVKLTAWFEDWAPPAFEPPADLEASPDWVVFDFDTVAQLIWTECSPNF